MRFQCRRQIADCAEYFGERGRDRTDPFDWLLKPVVHFGVNQQVAMWERVKPTIISKLRFGIFFISQQNDLFG